MSPASKLRFVVQEHRGRNLHYDFRLEIGGVLKSWAIPKGPSLDPAVKRLALMVEDHPLEHIDYEGIIPAKSYGAGPVLIWDRGTFEHKEEEPERSLSKGRLSFNLKGKKLKGGFTLMRLKKGTRGNEWLLIKKKDDQAQTGWILQSEMTGERLSRLKEKIPPCSTAS
jgi:bifunctional non-homologous end joining protein LigD